MNAFSDIRALLKRFENEIKTNKSSYDSTAESNKKRLHPNIVKEENDKLFNQLNEDNKTLRAEYLQLLQQILDNHKSENKSLLSNDIDFDLLKQFNTIASANIPLTEQEVLSFVNKAMDSKSSLCVRKAVDLAKNSGFDVQLPNDDIAVNALNNACKKVEEFIRFYDGGSISEQTTNYQVKDARLLTTFDFLKNDESTYNRYSTSEFNIVNSLSLAEQSMLNALVKDVPKGELKAKLLEYSADSSFASILNRSNYKELLQPDDYKIQINKLDDEDNSEATKYAKEYSQSMNTPRTAIPPLDVIIGD